MTEQAQFRIGGVYRQKNGVIVKLTGRGDTNAQAERVEHESKGQFRNSGGARRLSDGCYVFATNNPDYECHLVPGEVIERDGKWVPASIPFPSGSVVLTDGSQITGREEAQSQTYHYKGAGSVAIMVDGGASMTPTLDKLEQEAVANAPMIERDFRAPTDRERRSMTAVRESAWAAAIIEHAKSADQPKPYPFAAFISPDQRMTADSPTHGSAHLLKD